MSKPARRSVSFIVPFFDEAASLPRLLDELRNFIEGAKFRWPVDFDLIFVDDGSRDGGREVLKAYASANPQALPFRVIRLSRNFGKEIALSAGLSAATSDAVVLMDADLQHPVALVDQFLHGWIEEGCDVVYAFRRNDERDNWVRRMLGAAYYRLINATAEVAIPRDAADFRLLSRRAYLALRELGERQRLMKGLYSWIGFPQKGVPYVPRERPYGKSKFSLFGLWLLAVDGITSFSTLPLRLAVWAGFLLAVFAGGYGIWTIFEKFYYGIDVPGYPTLVVTIAFIGAAQLFFLGIIGEYIGKILIEVKRRPLFIVESDEAVKATASSSSQRVKVDKKSVAE
jgi:glycosyltransferase involved in cell wall biosynthesis